MNSLSPERWDQVDALFEQALDLGVADRVSLLEQVEDRVVRRAVERLLSAEIPEYLDSGAVAFAAPLLSEVAGDTHASLTPDYPVGPYRIECEIGRGGMGMVYKARHEGLGRYAALKFLPPHLSADGDMRERLLAEAQAAAALDHPNICTVYDIGEADDERLFIAMTYYEGETLRAEIARGPLAIERVLDVAGQVAKGLAAAHAVGIVHRDIKPANVMITADGVVKLLDFGLAKLEGSQAEAGRWGTVAYMSPEQVRGEEADHRTDVWSFGVMLYEMLTGQRPFARETMRATRHDILHESPEPVSSLRPDVQLTLASVVERSLATEPEERYATMREVLADVRAVDQEARLSTARPSSSSWLRWGVPVVLAVIALLVLAAVFLRSGDGEAPNSSASYLKVTTTGKALLPELSPDGTSIAYIERESETEQRVVMQDLDAANRVVVLDSCYDCWNLRWLPDGSGLSFSAFVDPERGGPVNFFVPRSGGKPEPLKTYKGTFSWSPDGSRYAGASTSDDHIAIVDRATGRVIDRIELDVPFTWFHGVEWSPRGDRLLFFTHDRERRYSIWTVALDGSNVHRVVETSSNLFRPLWAADGRSIYYLTDEGATESVMHIPVDPQSGAPTGPATVVLSGLETDDSFSLSGDGKRLAYARASLSSHLWLLSLADGETAAVRSAKPLTTGTSWSECPSISPDGQQVAFHRWGNDNAANIYVMPLAGGSPKQLTRREGKNTCPVWSPESEALVFGSNEGNGFELWTVEIDDGTLQPFSQTHMDRVDLAWASGRHILYPGIENSRFVMLDDETDEVKPILANPFEAWGRALSPRYAPDGKRVALWGTAPGASQTGLWTFQPESGELVLLQGRSGMVPKTPIGWSEDGGWIYVLERGARETHIERVHATTGETHVLAEVPEEIRAGLRNAHPEVTMTPDGKQFVFTVRQTYASDVVLVQNFDPGLR